MDDLLLWLLETISQDFFNGQWQHTHGVTIETIDNPGWRFKFDLKDTVFEHSEMEKILIERSDNDWYCCWKKDGFFDSACGPGNLCEVLKVFKDWYLETAKIIDVR